MQHSIINYSLCAVHHIPKSYLFYTHFTKVLPTSFCPCPWRLGHFMCQEYSLPGLLTAAVNMAQCVLLSDSHLVMPGD